MKEHYVVVTRSCTLEGGPAGKLDFKFLPITGFDSVDTQNFDVPYKVASTYFFGLVLTQKYINKVFALSNPWLVG